MKFNNLVNTFAAGEWSGKARYRTDAQQYFQASEQLLNFIPRIQGGAFRRPGTRRINLASARNTNLQTGISAGNPFFRNTTMIPRTLSDGYSEILVCCGAITDWFYFPTYDYTDASGVGSAPLSTPSTGLGSSNDNLQWSQVGDIVVIVDPAGTTNPILWVGTDLQIIDNDYITSEPWETVPYLAIQANGSSVNLTPSGTAGAITISASAAFFDSGHLGAYFKLSSGGTTGVVRITTVTSSTLVSATVLSTVAATAHGTAAGTSWEEAAWSEYRGWPQTVVAHESRLIYGGNRHFPDTIWGSAAGNVFLMMERPFEQADDFATYTEDNTRAFTLTPNSKEGSNIVALSSDKTLIIHTDRAEITGTGEAGILGPNDFRFTSTSSFGAPVHRPLRTGNTSLFIQKHSGKLRDIEFSFEQDKYKSNDLMFLADHLLFDEDRETSSLGSGGGTYRDPIIEVCAINSEDTLTFAKTKNGRLLALALDKDYAINAWANIPIGGDANVVPRAIVKAICSVGTEDGNLLGPQRLFMFVSRYINGAYVGMLESMDLFNERDNLIVAETFGGTGTGEQTHYVDAFKYGATANGTTWTGFTEYVGEELSVVADGFYLGEYTVNVSGQIITTDVYTTLYAGYPYTSRIKTMPIQIGQQVPGSPAGFTKRVDEAHISFYKTYGAKYGHTVGSLYTLDFKDQAANMDDPPVMYTGLKRVHLPTDYSRECQIVIEAQGPWPCNVLAIIARGSTYG